MMMMMMMICSVDVHTLEVYLMYARSTPDREYDD